MPLHSVTTGYNIFEIKVVIEQPDYIYICIPRYPYKTQGGVTQEYKPQKEDKKFKENVMSKTERN